MAKVSALLVLACAVLAPARALAEGQGFNFSWENDRVDHGHDFNYSNGLVLSVTTQEKSLDDTLLARYLPEEWFSKKIHSEYSLTSAMFTPRDLTRATPDLTDRPYAGILMFSAGLTSRSKRSEGYDQLIYSLGALGPDSGADEMQTSFHRWINGVTPAGWDQQIPNRILMNFFYQHTQRDFVWPNQVSPWAVRGFHNLGASVGNAQTSLSASYTLKAGYNIPLEMGMPRVAPSLPAAGYFSSEETAGAYAFVGAGGRYVSYDVSLDEWPAGQKNFITRRAWVSDAQAGVSMYYHWLRLQYTRVWRSKQFNTQRGTDGFGVFSIGFVSRTKNGS